MVNKKIEAALNEQIKKEEFSSRLYLAMAIWCEANGYPGAASFLYKHTEEERMHQMKLVHYVNDRGGKAKLFELEKPAEEFKSLHDLFTKVMEHEEFITQSINEFTD